MKAFPRSAFVFVLVSLSASLLAQGQDVYRHQDENGTTIYSDRPGNAKEQPVAIGPPNVTAPEATREVYREMQKVRYEEALQERYQQQSNEAAEAATQALDSRRAARRDQ